MNTWRERLLDYERAFEHPVARIISAIIVSLLILTPVVITILSKSGVINIHHRRELFTRYYSWLILTPAMLVPVLLGAGPTMVAVGLLGWFCFREFSRVTGLCVHKLIVAIVTLGIVLTTVALLDSWYACYMALTPLTIGVIAAGEIFRDQPQGYVQRVSLGIFGFALFGTCLSHLGMIAFDANYRPILLIVLLSVELNDVFAYIAGKSFGKRKLAPRTSPNKTVGGALGAVALTTTLVAVLGHYTFIGTPMDHPVRLVFVGLLISVLGQLGDLMLSSIKRDIGVKDMASVIPGHGGLLDRFDSVILVAPAVAHYISYVVGLGVGQPTRIFTGP